ncbi:MAG: DUF4433 domain-containing protein [Bacteroidaceae bacterium]|nr:DUF4433 domain-containing protein [Bacteroidaceae bacterium]
MEFFGKLKTIFFRPDYNRAVRNLSKRISELNAEKRKADVELEHLKKKQIKTPSFDIKRFEAKKIEIKPFAPPKPFPVRTMKDLIQKRREKAEEEERLVCEIKRLTSLVTRTKGEANEILDYLKENGIKRFYHFTDKRNIIGIRQLGGLYSWDYCERHGIEIPNPGGDDDSRWYDRKHDLQDYVRLSFCNDHPMAWRKHKEGSSLVLLYIDIDVATFEDTLFTDRNAASNSFACGGDLDALRKVDIQATRRNYVSRNEGEIFSLHQAECMIKTFIPLRYISNINNPQIMKW